MTADATTDKTEDDLAGYITNTEVARILEVNDARVRVLAQQGRFKDVINTRLGRFFRRTEVEAYKASRPAR